MRARWIFALLGGIALAGCQPEGSPAGPEEALVSAPAYGFTNGPTTAGRVFRYGVDEGFFFVASDEAFTTMAFHSPENGLLSHLLERCEETTATTPMNFHEVYTPDALRLLLQSEESYTYVFDVQPGWFAPPDFEAPTCRELLDNLIARGRSRFQYNDNDWFLTGRGTNTVSMKANGWLEDVLHGGEVRYHLSTHWQFQPDGDLRFPSMQLTLDPDPRAP